MAVSGSGVFGPPPVMGAPGSPTPEEPSDAVPGPRGPQPQSPSQPQSQSSSQDTAPTSAPSDRPGSRLSVSVSAASEGKPGGRGRRLSCTVALAIAGAMAAVLLGSAFLFDLLPGNGQDDTGGSGSDTAQSPAPSASTSTGGDADTDAPTAVPAAYLGTWEGQAVALDGTLPMGTFRLTVHRAGVGEELGTLRNTDVLGGVCDDVLTVKKVTRKQIVASAVGAGGNRGVCDQEAHTVRITPVGDDLEYQSDSEGSGRPEARLSKVG